MRNIFFLFFVLILGQPCMAATSESAAPEGFIAYSEDYQKNDNGGGAVADQKSDLKRLQIDNEFWYIVLLGLLCIFSLIVVLWFLQKHDHSPKDVVNTAGLILIIFGTIILVLVVSTSEQLTAAIGILGAIAGYLFRSVQDQGSEKGQAAAPQ